MSKFRKLNISFVSVMCLLMFPSLYSSASEAAASDIIEELVVTARKREENLLDILYTVIQEILLLDRLGTSIPG